MLLRFVRADRLDVTKALRRLLDYYTLLLEVFGEHIAFRTNQPPILFEDLDKQQRKLLESGWMQRLKTFPDGLNYLE